VTLRVKPHDLNAQKPDKMVVFGDAVFSHISMQDSFVSNHPVGAIGLFNNPQTSIFSLLPNISPVLVLARLQSLDGVKIETLDQLIAAIPGLMSKEKFSYKMDVSFFYKVGEETFPMKKLISSKVDYDVALRQPPFVVTFDYKAHTWIRTPIG
jgi:hypothetical protein